MHPAEERLQKPAQEIIVSEFREVFHWPLVLDAEKMRGDDGAKDAVRRAFDALSNSREWTAVDPVNSLKRDGTNDGGPYAEFVYFHDFTQKFLYPEWNSVSARSAGRAPGAVYDLFSRSDIDSIEAAIGEHVHTFSVERLTIHLFAVGVAILTLELNWQSSPTLARLNLAETQRIIDYLRRSYAPFFGEHDSPMRVPSRVTLSFRSLPGEAQGPLTSRPQTRSDVEHRVESPSKHRDALIFDHWTELVRPLVLLVNGGDWRDPSDERVPCHSYISLEQTGSEADTLRQIHDSDWIRIADAEEPGQFRKYPYNSDFLEDTRRTAYYDRFFPHTDTPDNLGTRHMFGGAHYAVVGSGWFFNNIILHHFRRHYTQLALIARFQVAAMLNFSSRVTDAVQQRDHTGRCGWPRTARFDFEDEIQRIQGDFLSFTHRFHFTGVSSQLQAGEMYERWRQTLHLDAIYADVKAELDSAADVVRSRQQTQTAANSERLAIFAAIGVTLGIVVGALGSNVLIDDVMHRYGFDGVHVLMAMIAVVGWISALTLWSLKMRKAPFALAILVAIAATVFVGLHAPWEPITQR